MNDLERPTLAEIERCPCCHPPRERPVRQLGRPGVLDRVWDVAKGGVGPSPYGGPDPFPPPFYYNVYWSLSCNLVLLGGVRPWDGVLYSQAGVHNAVYFWEPNDYQRKWRCWAIWATPCAVPWPCEATAAPEVIEDEEE